MPKPGPALAGILRLLAVAATIASAPPAIAGEADPLDALVAAYPEFLARHDGEWLIWRDGTRMPISDGIADKTFEERLDNPDIDDIFTQPYVPGRPHGPPGENEDPGRYRNAALFQKMYGDCTTGEVEPRLRPIRWVDGTTLLVTDVNGVADRLQRVAGELAALPPAFRKYLVPSAGVYNCRVVAGTNNMSMHALGAAIDISTAHSDYWRWTTPIEGKYPYRNRIPYEIVAIFEKYGFIWGGKWYHFDTMHFSYRPEMLLASGVKPAGF